jgi:uncharacterized membrane protein
MRGADQAGPAREGLTGAAKPIPAARGRLDSIDLLRGLIMVVMALDHTRDFFSSARFDPTDLSRTTLPYFFTRFITHFCAPTFLFLAGTGAYLAGLKMTRLGLARFLVTRGLWIVFLELSVVWCLGWSFSFNYQFVMGGVLWTIGWSMVILAVLVLLLPTWAIGLFGIVMIAGHNLLDGVGNADLARWHLGSLGWLWSILHSGGPIMPFHAILPTLRQYFPKMPDVMFFPMYRLVPWVGVMAAGYAFGTFFLMDQATRRRRFIVLGLALTALFVALRWCNRYGDAPAAGSVGPWSEQARGPEFTVCSFLNCQKYPPSLVYLLMTLGPAIVLLGLFERPPGFLGRRLVIFGRVPMFFYLLHLPLIHGLSVLVQSIVRHFPAVEEQVRAMGRPPDDGGFDLCLVYAVWLGCLLVLYPLCYWFAGVKRRHRSAWLSYI